MSGSTSVPPAGPWADKLKVLTNTKILVVDDAFDPPDLDLVDSESILQFVEELEQNQELAARAAKISGKNLNDTTDIDSNTLQALWRELFPEDQPGEEDELAQLAARTILFDKNDKLKNVLPFCKTLSELGLEIIKCGSLDSKLPTAEIGLALIDYVLGPEPIGVGNPSHQDARSAAAKLKAEKLTKEFYKDYPAANKPFIVLMSSRDRGTVATDTFREHTDLIGGLFDFVTKQDLCRPEVLRYKLLSWNFDLPTRHTVQRFVQALLTATDSALGEFKKTVSAFKLQDYAYLQSFALQHDGTPLGEYILWLFSTYLSEQIQSSELIDSARHDMDGLEFLAVPSNPEPSLNLATLYQNSVSSIQKGGLSNHPRDRALELSAHTNPNLPLPSDQLPYIQLGDLFTKDSTSPVWMVLNAACDLSWAPNATRKPKPEQSILLLPGDLVPLHGTSNLTADSRTDLFQFRGVYYRILWRPEKVFTSPHQDLRNLVDKAGYTYSYRLRAPWALAVQQQFAARLTRIGLPVSPPYYVGVDAKAYCMGGDGKYRSVGKLITNGATFIHRRHKNADAHEFVLTESCVMMLISELESVAKSYEDCSDSIDGGKGKRSAKMRDRAKLVRDLISSPDFWHGMTVEPMPVKPQVTIKPGFLHIHHAEAFSEAWLNECALVLSLEEPDPPFSPQAEL